MTIEQARRLRVGDRVIHSASPRRAFTVIKDGAFQDPANHTYASVRVNSGPETYAWDAWVSMLTYALPPTMLLPEGV